MTVGFRPARHGLRKSGTQPAERTSARLFATAPTGPAGRGNVWTLSPDRRSPPRATGFRRVAGVIIYASGPSFFGVRACTTSNRAAHECAYASRPSF